MNTTNIATKYAVTTPKTSIELDWKKETVYFWRKYQMIDGTNYALFLKKDDISVLVNAPFDLIYAKRADKKDIPALQMHEIAQSLPLWITYKGEFYQLSGNKYVAPNDIIFEVPIKNYHFAEAYALLYIKLREAGLLKEVQDA